MNPSMSVASSTQAVRQITPSTPIVLSAEALTSLLMMNASPQQQQQQVGQSQPATSSVELNSQILQYMAEQAVQAVTLSVDSVNVPTVTELSGSSAAMDLEVGAQEMVSEEGAATQKQHPLHLN